MVDVLVHLKVCLMFKRGQNGHGFQCALAVGFGGGKSQRLRLAYLSPPWGQIREEHTVMFRRFMEN